MMMCAPEDEQEFVTRTIDRGEITPNRSKPNHYSVSYDDTLLLHFFIMKKDGCHKQEDFRMSGDELHYVRLWLESPKKPTELVVPENEDEITTYYYGVFTSVQPYIIDGDCYGLRLEFTCDSPYGYSEEHVLTYDIPHKENLFYNFNLIDNSIDLLEAQKNEDNSYTINGVIREGSYPEPFMIIGNGFQVLNVGKYIFNPGGDENTNVRLGYRRETTGLEHNVIHITDNDYMNRQWIALDCKIGHYFDNEITTPEIYRYDAVRIDDSIINISSEKNERLYPTIEITSTSTFGEDETISFINVSDNNRTMDVQMPHGLSKLVIDCEKKIITDEQNNLVALSDIGLTTPVNEEYDVISTDIFSFNWFSFVHGNNDFVIDLEKANSIDTIEMRVRFKIKSGGF